MNKLCAASIQRSETNQSHTDKSISALLEFLQQEGPTLSVHVKHKERSCPQRRRNCEKEVLVVASGDSHGSVAIEWWCLVFLLTLLTVFIDYLHVDGRINQRVQNCHFHIRVIHVYYYEGNKKSDKLYAREAECILCI